MLPAIAPKLQTFPNARPTYELMPFLQIDFGALRALFLGNLMRKHNWSSFLFSLRLVREDCSRAWFPHPARVRRRM